MNVTVAYRSPLVTLYHGDAIDAIELLSRNDAQLIVTDPPYGMQWQSNMRSRKFARMVGDDGTLDVPGLLGGYTRTVLWANQHVYVFGHRPDELAGPLRLSSVAELVWDKGSLNMGDLSLPWSAQHEPITFGVYSDCNNARVRRGGLTARLRRGSVIKVQRRSGLVQRHATEKPVELLRQLIESSSVPGDVVLDPFVGSGSTCVAAILEGRRAIGIDSDEKCIDTAVQRVKAAEAVAAQMAGL